MADEKPYKYDPQESLPIPTYDEATSSRPPSSQAFLGPSEVSHDSERQTLLGRRESPIRSNGYQPPTVESARSSLDFLPSSGGNSGRGSLEVLRQEMTQMEVLDPQVDQDHSLIGARISKHISNFTSGLSSIQFPFRQWFPSLDYVRDHLPRLPDSFKPGWIMATRLFAFFLVLSLAYILFVSDIFTFRRGGGAARAYAPEAVRQFVQDQVNETYIMQNSEHLTKFDHIAGTEGNYVLAKWVEAAFGLAELDNIELEQFDVYLNYPRKDGRRVAIIDPPGMMWEAQLEEEMAYTDPPRQQTLVFHGHSRSGNVTGPLVYANYGSRQDFKTLQDKGISLNGTIALVRYYGTQGDRSLKVKAAELAGAVGCIIYSDPNEDGFVNGKVYPEGRFMPADGVQRGAVSLMSWVVGDVLSPGFASTPDEKHRVSKDNNPGLNNIPSIPLSWRDAQKLLQALKGHGHKLTNANGWIGGVPDVEWWTGDPQSSPIVHLKNEQDEEERQPIYNVLGKIQGAEQPEKSIIVGNHRDAWCFGAVDPGSGTAVFLEIVRIFGELKKRGWRPLRTIEFASWDGEEYNLIGSTEHVEARVAELRRDGFAYINVDVAVMGENFTASASPLLEKALLRVLDRTSDPNSGQTLRSLWDTANKTLRGLGAGSDYVAFQDIAGTSSIDMGFGGPPFPYHSCYDNFRWMSELGDPGFKYHKLLGQVWALLILELADRPILPFDLEAYARAVKGYVEDLEKYARTKDAPSKGGKDAIFDLKPLHEAAQTFTANAHDFHRWGRAWSTSIESGAFENNAVQNRRMDENTKMANFETDLLDINGGLPGREQFKHVIFAPQAWSGYDEAYFPGIRDAVDDLNWDLAQKQVEKVANILNEASYNLVH